MLVAQVFFHGENHAFHLYINVDFKKGNTILSTIPVEVLNKYHRSTIIEIENAFVPSEFAANHYLEQLGKRILKNSDLHCYFYPEYLLQNGRLPFRLVEEIIKYQEILPLVPGAHYCQYSCPPKFFVLNSIYERKKRLILKTGQETTSAVFMDYLTNDNMMQDFQELDDSESHYLMMYEEGELEYLLLIDKATRLKMIISM
ncbi:MAG: hypothetical protein KDC84_01250 [Crocinitomicaceae bacterium]|nr:hypothetical protein [Crocinitomicaceae bacterium]